MGNQLEFNPKKNNQIEYSTVQWRNLGTLGFSGSGCGDFQDLIDNGKEILANTSKGLFIFTDEWNELAQKRVK